MRTLPLAAACLVAGIFIGQLLADGPDPIVVTLERDAAAPEPPRDAPSEPRLAGRGPIDGSTPERPAAGQPSTGAVAAPHPDDAGADAEPVDPRIVARIEVTVPKPEGATYGYGDVYALPAGSQGVDDEELIPHAGLEGETAVIPLPRAGRWDVGYAGAWGEALVAGVEVAAGATVPVRLVLPPQAPITVYYTDGDASAWACGRNVHVWGKPYGVVNARDYPGRGQQHKWQTGQSIRPSQRGPTPVGPFPAGREFTLRLKFKSKATEKEAHGISLRQPYPRWQLKLERDRARAGDRIGITLVEQAYVHLTFVLRDRAGKSWPDTLALPVQALLKHGDRVVGDATARVWGGRLVRKRTFRIFADPGSATLVWDGACCLPGRIDGMELKAGDPAVVQVPIDLDPQFELPTDGYASQGPTRVRVEGRFSKADDTEVIVYAADAVAGGTLVKRDVADDWFDPDSAANGAELTNTDWKGVRTAAAVHGPDRAARPVPLVPGGGTAVLKLVAAGLLVVVPEWWSTRDLGALMLRRSDRVPVPICSMSEGEGRPSSIGPLAAVEAQPGVLIGPLVPGTYEFEVLLGSTPIRRVRGTVRAGRVDVLRLPR